MQGAILLLFVIGAMTVLHYVGFSHLFKVWQRASLRTGLFFSLGCGLLVLLQACLPSRVCMRRAGRFWRAGPDWRRGPVQGTTVTRDCAVLCMHFPLRWPCLTAVCSAFRCGRATLLRCELRLRSHCLFSGLLTAWSEGRFSALPKLVLCDRARRRT